MRDMGALFSRLPLQYHPGNFKRPLIFLVARLTPRYDNTKYLPASNALYCLAPQPGYIFGKFLL